jgi:serine protease
MLTLRRLLPTLICCAVAAAAGPWPAAGASAGPAVREPPRSLAQASGAAPAYVPGQVLIGYRASTPVTPRELARRIRPRTGAGSPSGTLLPSGPAAPSGTLLRLPPGTSVPAALARLRRIPGVAWAVPNYIAHAVGTAPPAGFIPNDPGRAHTRGGWQALQWNFMPADGVDAPEAWANLIADHRPGGRGAVVAILDTGVAYRNWGRFRKSPDFGQTRFVDPYDFVAGNRFPLDRDGHGTFVAGMVAESTNNGIGLTGLAYGASIMPVRVLDGSGDGNALEIARGIRYAVAHHAQVINLSLEFDPGTTAADIPEVLAAIHYARQHGVLVVAAAGNDSAGVAYPARAPDVVSVGATTSDRCLAYYSDTGGRLDLVAPGGGDDSDITGESNCRPFANLPGVYQMTFDDPARPGRFGLTSLAGTSMAAPAVSATAALVIASGVLGPHPSPAQLLSRLEQTAQPLGPKRPNPEYGYGLVDAAAATAPASGAPSPQG